MNNLSTARDILTAASLIDGSKNSKVQIIIDGKLSTLSDAGISSVHNLSDLKTMVDMQGYMNEFKEKINKLTNELTVTYAQLEELCSLVRESQQVDMVDISNGILGNTSERSAYDYSLEQRTILNRCSFAKF